MGNITKVVQDNVVLQVPATLTRGALLASTLDLRPGSIYTGPIKAKIALCLGRTDATNALSKGVDVIVYRVPAAQSNGLAIGQLTKVFARQSDMVVATLATTLNGTHNAGAASLTVAAYTQANLLPGQMLMVYNGSTLSRCEWIEAAVSASTTSILLRSPLAVTRGANADNVTNLAQTWECEVDGGYLYMIVFDYTSQTTGGSVVVAATAAIETSFQY